MLIQALFIVQVFVLNTEVRSNEHTRIEISTNGQEHLLNCSAYKGQNMYWRKLSLFNDKTFDDIFDGFEVLKNLSKTFEIVANSTDLLIKQTTKDEAGVYQCPSAKIHLIVVENVTCNESSINDLFHKINCSFSFKADESCIVTALLIDQKTNESVAKHKINHSSGYGDGFLWLRLDGNVDIRVGLAVIFNCSNASAYHHVQYANWQRPQRIYFKALLPIILICCVSLTLLLIVIAVGITRLRNKRKENSAVSNKEPRCRSTLPEVPVATNFNEEECVEDKLSTEFDQNCEGVIILNISLHENNSIDGAVELQCNSEYDFEKRP